MFRILAIDGGGLRGIIPIQVLRLVESMTGKSIAESFDLIAGTSTGGILACGLTVSDKHSKRLIYDIDKLEEIYKTDGKVIFPKTFFKNNYTGPKFSPAGLEKTLEKYFKGKLLSDCKKPILVSSYDLHHNATHYFSSRFINPLSADYDSLKNFSLLTICRATSAAPTYLPSFPFTYLDGNDNHKTHNFIDGGVFVNNPTLAAVVEVLGHNTDLLYNKQLTPQLRIENPITIEDIHVLSLGTGKPLKQITEKNGGEWGPIGWGRPLIDIMMQGNSLSVHHQASILLGERYLRINMDVPSGISDMDDSSEDTATKLIAETNRLIINNQSTSDRLATFVKNAGL